MYTRTLAWLDEKILFFVQECSDEMVSNTHMSIYLHNQKKSVQKEILKRIRNHFKSDLKVYAENMSFNYINKKKFIIGTLYRLIDNEAYKRELHVLMSIIEERVV